MEYVGTVSVYFLNRNFGFILSDDDGSSRFFHTSHYNGQPRLGDRVEFELAEPTRLGKSKQAVNVTPILGGAQ